MPLVSCTENVVHKTADPPVAPAPEQTTEPTDPPVEATPDPKAPTSNSKAPEDRCLDGQDMDGADVDLKACPELPDIPDSTLMGKATIDLGAWEIGTTADGQTYKYGSLSGANPRMLNFSGGKVAVNDQNVECWAKGYYRLRKILQTPPAAYVALHKAGFQFRFFQFQTDLRNGRTGYTEISSFEDHLVKWVTIVDAKGACKQPTLTQFRDYAKGELTTRGLPVPAGN
ncbi:hypothetical protein BH11MYX4_BH11MYX4_20130 [soil metagenome]